MVNQAAPLLNDISQILDNQILLVAVAACLIAQAIKLTIDTIQNGKVSVKVLTTTGGMPSAPFSTSYRARGWSRTEFGVEECRICDRNNICDRRDV